MRVFHAPISGRALGQAGPAGPASHRAARMLAAPLAAVAAGSLATVLLASGTSAASVPGPQPGLAPGAVSYESPAPNGCGCGTDLYYTGTDGAVWAQGTSPKLMYGPVSRGGHLLSGPAPVHVPSGVLANVESSPVFGRGTDNALWWTDPDLSQPWASLGGALTSKPGVISEGTAGPVGDIAVFARGTDHAVWYTFHGPQGWHGWSKLGGQLYPGTGPAAVYVSGTVDVVAVGTDQRVYVNRTSDGSNWSGWTLLGGRVSNAGGDPAATAPTSSTGVAFVRGTDNAVWYDEFTGGATPGWHSLGGRVTSGIGATTGTNGATHLFALGADNTVWEDSGTFPAMSGWSPAP